MKNYYKITDQDSGRAAILSDLITKTCQISFRELSVIMDAMLKSYHPVEVADVFTYTAIVLLLGRATFDESPNNKTAMQLAEMIANAYVANPEKRQSIRNKCTLNGVHFSCTCNVKQNNVIMAYYVCSKTVPGVDL